MSRVAAGENIRESVENIGLFGGLEPAINRGDRVLVKPNFNSPGSTPASTEPRFLLAVVESLKETGAKVTIGECSGGMWRPTRNVFQKKGLRDRGPRPRGDGGARFRAGLRRPSRPGCRGHQSVLGLGGHEQDGGGSLAVGPGYDRVEAQPGGTGGGVPYR